MDSFEPSSFFERKTSPQESPWTLPEQEPTNLLALWPDKHAPSQTEVTAAFRQWLGDALVGEEELPTPDDDDEIAWCHAMRIRGFNSPVVIWAEPVRSMAPNERRALGAERCEWLIGFETVLSCSDPLSNYIELMRLVGESCMDVPAVLDVNTTRWHDRQSIDEVFCSQEVEPPADVLWLVQAVQPDGSKPDVDNRCIWLHTHGLWRCGAPELEMLEVPLEHASAAAELLNDIAALLLEQAPPSSSDRFEIGTDLHVSLLPWQAIVNCLPKGVPGGLADRKGDHKDGHGGVRAVVCTTRPELAAVKKWHWPAEVIRRLSEDEAGVYMTRRATERQAALAQRAWAELAMAFASACPIIHRNGTMTSAIERNREMPPVVFGVKAGFADDTQTDSREHLWFEIRQFEGDRAKGILINQPLNVRQLERGSEVWIDRGLVSDWRVMTHEGCYGPNDVASMWRAIDKAREQGESS